jgi:hypothetical protein
MTSPFTLLPLPYDEDALGPVMSPRSKQRAWLKKRQALG